MNVPKCAGFENCEQPIGAEENTHAFEMPKLVDNTKDAVNGDIKCVEVLRLHDSSIFEEFEEVEGKTRFEEFKESLNMETRMLKPHCNKRKQIKRKRKRSNVRIKKKKNKYHYQAKKVKMKFIFILNVCKPS